MGPDVKQVVQSSEPTEDVSLLVSIRLKDDLSQIAKISDRGLRADMLQDLYTRVKRPIVETISKYERYGIRVVNELSGSPQLIISGPARGWLHIIDEEEPSLNNPNVVFQANQKSWGTSEKQIST